jgi:hypothetical protein
VGSLVRPVRTSICLAFQDMWQFYGQRVLTGLSVAILAIVLALVATGAATLWTLWAYAIFIGCTYFICLGLRLVGWHRLWRPSYRHQPPGELQLWLYFKGLVGMRLGLSLEFTCEVRDPSGTRYMTRPGRVQGGGSAVWCTYPNDFDGAPALIQGIYTIVWKERRPRQTTGQQPPGSGGRWRLMEADRTKI